MTPRAHITHACDGTLVLVDPDASAMIAALGKDACKRLLAANAERLAHFAEWPADLRVQRFPGATP